MAYWNRHKYLEYQSVHGQLWRRKQLVEIPDAPKPEMRRPDREIGYISGRLSIVRPRPKSVEAFAEEYPGIATRLETDDNTFSVTQHNETEGGGETWLDLVLGKYRLRLTKKYANLFLDFLSQQRY